MDVSGWVELPTDRIARLKKELLAINIAEMQHILNFLQKERDDLLIAVSFTHSFFTMDVAHFKEFKNWLQAEGIIEMDSMIAEAISSIQVSSLPEAGPLGCEDQEQPVRRLTGPSPPEEE